MRIEEKILDFIKAENKDLEIAGLRGLVKTNENEWSFRFTYMDEDFLSISKLYKVKLEGVKKTPVFITKTKNKKTKQILKTIK
jgi:hypothetical protein